MEAMGVFARIVSRLGAGWDNYYGLLAEVIAGEEVEIALFRAHAAHYSYLFYILRTA